MTADAVGGVWTYAEELARALEADGCNVTIAALGPEPPPRAGVRHLPCLLEWQDDPWADVRAAGEWLLELERELRPDAVHLNSYALGACGWEAPALVVGHSCVLSWHEAVRGVPAPAAWGRYRDAVRRGLHAADAVVAPTHAMLAALRRLYALGAAGHAIHNGLAAHAPPARDKEERVLAAGRLWDQAKGLDTLARAAERIAWPVEVAGDHAGAGSDHVRLLGRLPRDELRTRMARAAIFAHPARYEPFGLVVLEAALAGCALVLGDIPSLRELWDGTALFVAPGDADGLADAIDMLIASPDLRSGLAAAAQRRARQYDVRAMARSYRALYASLPARAGAAA